MPHQQGVGNDDPLCFRVDRCAARIDDLHLRVFQAVAPMTNWNLLLEHHGWCNTFMINNLQNVVNITAQIATQLATAI